MIRAGSTDEHLLPVHFEEDLALESDAPLTVAGGELVDQLAEFLGSDRDHAIRLDRGSLLPNEAAIHPSVAAFEECAVVHLLDVRDLDALEARIPVLVASVESLLFDLELAVGFLVISGQAGASADTAALDCGDTSADQVGGSKVRPLLGKEGSELGEDAELA